MQREFARSYSSLKGIFGFVRQFFESESVDPSHRYAVELAIEEIFTNMVKYSKGSAHNIRVQLEREDHHIEVCITDFDVEPFDPTQAGDVAVDRPIEERRPGGLGLHLIKKLFDSMEYEYIDRQSKITLKKNLEVT
jgi:anti-sigma regulatory factor (Ser/Thr protein kinase)